MLIPALAMLVRPLTPMTRLTAPLCTPIRSSNSIQCSIRCAEIRASGNLLRDPVGQKLGGVRVLMDRYRSVGLTSIHHHFYPGGRHEMLHEINRRDMITNLLVWISGMQALAG
jgi:hypothetical protein